MTFSITAIYGSILCRAQAASELSDRSPYGTKVWRIPYLKIKLQEASRIEETLTMSEVDPNPGAIEPQSSEPQPVVPTPAQNRVFIGPNGLRAGWSLAIYCLIIAACLTVLHFAANAVHAYLRHGKPPVHPPHIQVFAPGPRILQEVFLLLCALLAAWIMSRIEKRPFGEYGLGGNSRRLPQFLQGFCWGFRIYLLVDSVPLPRPLYRAHRISLHGFER